MKTIGYKNDDRQKGFSGYFLSENDLQQYLISKGFEAKLLNSKTTSKVFVEGVYFDLTFRPEKDGLTCRIENKGLHDVLVPYEFSYCTTYINIDHKFTEKYLLDAFLQMHKDKLKEEIKYSLAEETLNFAKSFFAKDHSEYPHESFIFNNESEVEEF